MSGSNSQNKSPTYVLKYFYRQRPRNELMYELYIMYELLNCTNDV